MYRNKKDVDKYVDNLFSKVSPKEFNTRAYSVARLYFDVGDYANCQRYVEQYLTQKDNNAAAHKLLGQALHKQGYKEKALEQYKTALDIDPTQTSTILDICALLADDELIIDPGRAKYWCEKAESTFPRHPVTFRLREKIISETNPNPEAIIKLLTTELTVRPKDVNLHCRLIKQYLQTNNIETAFNYCCDIEFGSHNFVNNYIWYETLIQIFKHDTFNCRDWLYQLLFLTVNERICALSLIETPNGPSKGLVETNEHLHSYDQALKQVINAGPQPGFGEFHTALVKHHHGQLALHLATYILKKAKKDQISWREAASTAAPLMLMAWQAVPLDLKVNWILHAPEKQKISVHRWYKEGAYRCSQSGHYLLSNNEDKTQSFLDRVSQMCVVSNWKERIYQQIFTNKAHQAKMKSSYLACGGYTAPVLRLPRKMEVEAYDADAQREYPNSLHHFVWILRNYKNYATFICTLFDSLTPTSINCSPETLNKLDIYAFLYFATLTSQQQNTKRALYIDSEKPILLPANITDLQCSLSQMKWWDCAYKFSQNELGSELTDICATLNRGVEVVRCIDNHGLDPELLCLVARIFGEKANSTSMIEERNKFDSRAAHYYSSAIPLLEKLKNKMVIKIPEKRLFDYTHKEQNSKLLKCLLEECKLYVGRNYFNACEYDKCIEILSKQTSPEAYYYLSQSYKKLAIEENNFSKDSIDKSKYATLMMRSKNAAYKALDEIKNTQQNRSHPLYPDIQQLIEDIELHINKVDLDLSAVNEIDGKYSSDDNISSAGSEHVNLRSNHQNIMYRNLSSTPKQPSNPNLTNYRTAVESQMLETTRADPLLLDKIETQLKTFHRRLADDFIEQTKGWFEENRRLSNQIMSTIQSDIENTTDQFKLLKLSVDQIKDQVDECRTECKDVGELKKQVAELKKEVCKLKKPLEQNINEELYNLEDDYRTTESSGSFSSQLPFQTPQVMPTFNQRVMPPFPGLQNPYQIYSQSLYNLYNQYAQFSQTSGISAVPPLFDPTKLSYPGVYPTPDQMYLDVAHLVPPTISTVPPVASMPVASSVPPVTVSTVPTSHTSIAAARQTATSEIKDSTSALPVNVIITSSDPLPTCTTAPAPVLSVTIPPQHIKGTPHNYQIPMPSNNSTNVASPPSFTFPTSGTRITTTTATSLANWNHSNIFKNSQSDVSHTILNSSTDKSLTGKNMLDNTSSPNTSLNKSRTLSERSNTSIENYDPCPDFKPIIPLPAEVKVTTGEEDEAVIFCARAKLYRFVDKQWKERGIGEMKLLKHKVTSKVRVLMRREQIHKICANHIIMPEMEINPMKNETKAYIWVANDYADESVILEKFCVRFKTADIALQFYELFERARQDSKLNNSSSPKPNTSNKIDKDENGRSASKITIPSISKFSPTTQQQSKTEFGGFTFSSTPTLKPVLEGDKVDTKLTEPPTSKVNVFSNLTFKSSAVPQFSNIFSTTSNTTSVSSPQIVDTPTKHDGSSDTVEEYEPNVEFKPIIPLPALIEQKTGEEEERTLFEHRAKLLRFDATVKEWKERGLGNIKLLVHKENVQKVRLLMRREQIMKVCCNHAITKDMSFEKMPNVKTAVTWCAKDFSDGELVAETFCLRFKNASTCDEFIAALKSAQSKMKDESKFVKEEENAAKQNSLGGFGDKFKPKPGAWHCDTCYTNNLENFTKCACCEQAKPGSDGNESKNNLSKWGDKFKPDPNSWECNVCLIRNASNVDYCTACVNPKDPSMPKKETNKSILTPNNSLPKFNFGIPAQPKLEPTSSSTIGFGDQFKLKEGSWICKQCNILNDSNIKNCAACTKPCTPNADNNQNSSLFGSSKTKFSFGIPSNPKVETTSIFDGTGVHKFKFGVPSVTQEKTTDVIPFGNKQPIIFGALQSSTEKEVKPLNLTSNKDTNVNNTSAPLTKTALLPTPTIEPTICDTEKHTFDFVFKPKSPHAKGKSPLKSPKAQGGDSDGDEYASEDEGHHIHFNPVIPLPDKVEVVTGEENERVLYEHRAKLYIFVSGEWKERGIGIVKILKHIDTGKLRIVMRREQVLKICLNHALTPDVKYTNKDDKTWFFAANDFSEGEIQFHQFCLKFKTKEIAEKFRQAVENAMGNNTSPQMNKQESRKNEENDEVTFVSETLATAEEKIAAKNLMLPENFFTYKNMKPCKGCRGCDENEEVGTKSQDASSTAKTAASFIVNATPVKTTGLSFQSPTTTIYGTPSSFDKTTDESMFLTPLGSLGSNGNLESPNTPSSTIFGKKYFNKENTLQKSVFGIPTETTSNSDTREGESTNKFGVSDEQNKTNTTRSVLAPPKLNTLATPTQENNVNSTGNAFNSTQTKSNFNQKPLFSFANAGMSSNKSIFSSIVDNKSSDNAKSEVKSIFSGETKPFNLFSTPNQGSEFGVSTMPNNPHTTGVNSKQPFGHFGDSSQAQNIFQSAVNASTNLKLNATPEQKSEDATVETSNVVKNDDSKPTNENPQDPLLKIDHNLSFAALSSVGSEATFISKKEPDFKWEGAGQQLFSGSQKPKNTNENSKEDQNESGAGGDEEYDPYYEPIVPLPEKIVVTTGEEDEEKLFGERSKLYRYDDKNKEWKERGVGEMKILYHPIKNTYRLLLRREQVHKAVLNMLIHMDMELRPMKNSDCAWSWAGCNFAETTQGEQELLAARFKSQNLAEAFKRTFTECTRKMQAAAAKVIREEETGQHQFNVAPLRLPKHLENSDRADSDLSATVQAYIASPPQLAQIASQSGATDKAMESTKQVKFQEPEKEQPDEDEHAEDEDYDQYEYSAEDYEHYYNEDEESAVYYECEGEAVVRSGEFGDVVSQYAHVQVLFDQECCAPKILVSDIDTGEILADMLIHTDTEFQMDGDSCIWSGTDYTSNEAVDKTVTFNFPDLERAMQFYDSCETSKTTTTYTSTDPET